MGEEYNRTMVCVYDGRALNFYTANKIGEVVDSGIAPNGPHPETTIHRDKELGASYQHVYNCGVRGYKKNEL